MMTEDAIFVCVPPKKVVRKNSEDVGDEMFREWNPSRHFFGGLVKSQPPSCLPGRKSQKNRMRCVDLMIICVPKIKIHRAFFWGGFFKDPPNIRDI